MATPTTRAAARVIALASRRPAAALVFALAMLAIVAVPALQHAFFDLDDYRYLAALPGIFRGEPGALRAAMVVENRWDSVWWIPQGTFVRFFRPFVILSYALDHWLWALDPRGYVASNFLLHAAATTLFWACLRQWFEADATAIFVATLSFAVQGSRWENLAYVAGRTDTLAALPVLSAMLAYGKPYGQRTPARQLWAASACFCAFLCKEYTIVVPGLLLLFDSLPAKTAPKAKGLGDRLVVLLRRNFILIAASSLFFCLYLGLRAAAFSPEGSGVRPYPYFYLPSRPHFAARSLAALAQYAHGLVTGEFVRPFLNTPDQLVGSAAERALACGWLIGLLAWSLLRRDARWLAASLMVTLLPLLIVYTSGRYLYLPSIGYCSLLGLAISRLAAKHAPARVAAAALAILMVVLPGARLFERFAELPRVLRLGIQRDGVHALLEQRQHLDLTRPVYLLDFPGTWFEMQFAASTLAVVARTEAPALAFITARTPDSLPLTARSLDAHTISLSREGSPLIAHAPDFDFDYANLSQGRVVHTADYALTVVEAMAGVPTRLNVRFTRPLSELQIHAFPPTRTP